MDSLTPAEKAKIARVRQVYDTPDKEDECPLIFKDKREDVAVPFEARKTALLEIESVFEDFKNIIKVGYSGMELEFMSEIGQLNTIPKTCISQSALYGGRYPSGGIVYLHVTHGCLRILREINLHLDTSNPLYRKAIIGPSGMGKSYGLLYNLMAFRRNPGYKVLYINNPELLHEALYMVKELIYCFACDLHNQKDVTSDKPFLSSCVSDCDYENCSTILDILLKSPSFSEDDVFQLLWAFYIRQ